MPDPQPAPETTALIVVDMLNRYDHADAEPLMESVAEMLPTLQSLISAAQEEGVLVVYVNDNYIDVVIPHDAVAHIRPDLAKAALKMMDVNMSAAVVGSSDAFSTRHSS
jgi:hypothetical protein